jgi:hypothetical protein
MGRGVLLAYLSIALSVFLNGGGRTAEPPKEEKKEGLCPPVLSGKKSYRVLILGNSYTKGKPTSGLDLAITLKALANSGPSPVILDVQSGSVDGSTLEDHWKERRQLLEKGWDAVVLQEESTRPLFKKDLMLEYATKLDGEIRKKGGKTVLMMVWSKFKRPGTYEAVKRTHTDIASKLKARIAPVGTAWKLARSERPDTDIATKKDPFGFYLNACVIYAVLTGRSPEGLSNAGMKGLDDDTAAFLQKIAAKAVSDFDTQPGADPKEPSGHRPGG